MLVYISSINLVMISGVVVAVVMLVVAAAVVEVAIVTVAAPVAIVVSVVVVVMVMSAMDNKLCKHSFLDWPCSSRDSRQSTHC